MTALLEKWKIPKVDVLKLDIEGSEATVFANACHWLKSVEKLFIEVHEWIELGVTQSVMDQLKEHGHRSVQCGNVIYTPS